MSDEINHIRRALDDMPRDYPEVMVRLIDALREFIRTDNETAEDLLRDGTITRQQYDDGQKDTDRFRQLLKELEAHEIDPTLRGTLR